MLYLNLYMKMPKKEKKIFKINKLVDICARLEDEGKIFVSESREITLV